ncbi:hypothetical protein PPERSA_08584 [Pseudocohnilembus persalinus]|uniref:C2HC/C3H-type domain-containing protein n=1 Tax=Pseudocohnilembus persalinus TaxID=266149 RepID=A0A0V0R7I4_PSEPJ|nr:hypothetical protein PPERSA_08584 [Pseudocohnilembus persalinus]|eukprot:KRX10181.1 hypothetical protein PPERSA_08584 [Pseudocohnilembus persalinus]
MQKRQTLQNLNQKLKIINQEKTTLQNAGKAILQSGGGFYNASQINLQIPVKATGKLGQNYYNDNNIKPSNENMHNALLQIKKKIRHKELEEQGIYVNHKVKVPIQSNQEHTELISGLDHELYNQPNKHYRKIFDANYFYGLNEGNPNEEFELQQREEIEREYYTKNQGQSRAKSSLLKRANESKKIIQVQQQQKLEKYQHELFLESMAEQRQQEFEGLVSQNNLTEISRSQKIKKGILKNINNKNSQDQNFLTNEPRKSPKKQIKFLDEEQKRDMIYQSEQDLNKAKKIPKWKLQSQSIRAALRPDQDRSYQQNQLINEGLQNKDLIPCPYCKRKFNQNASERHIPLCKEKQLENNLKKKNQKSAKYFQKI